MKAKVIFTETTSKRSMMYEPVINFSTMRGMKIALRNCLFRNIENLRLHFGFCKNYAVEVVMKGEIIAKTTFAA